jgi:hypothetical protein
MDPPSNRNWLRRHGRSIAFVALCIGGLAGISTFADNVFKIWDRIFPNHVADADPPTVNREKKSDSLLDISTIAKSTIYERWVNIDGTSLSELIASGEIIITTPANEKLWPKIRPWDYIYGVDYKLQGDGDGVTITVWHSCLTPGPKRPGVLRQCSKSPEYRRKHHLHTPQWKG